MQGKVRQATWRARTIAPVFSSQDPMDALLSANSGNLPSDPNQDHFLNFKSPKTFSLPGAYIGPVFARKLVGFWVKDFDGRFCVLSGIGRIWLFQSKCLFCTPICRGPENHSHIYCRISSQNLLCQERCLRGHNLPLWLPLWLALARPRPKAFLGCIKYCKIFSVFEAHPALKWKIGSSIRETFCHWDQKV